MSRQPLIALLFVAMSGAAALSQAPQVVGTTLRVATLTISRGLLGSSAGEIIQRFDASQLTGFGVEDAYPGSQVVRGVLLTLYPFSATCDVIIYGEDPAAPNYPDLNNPLATALGVVPQFFAPTTVLFSAPALVPLGRDVFVSVRVGPGTYVGFLSTAGTTYFDLPGPGWPTSPPEEASYCSFRIGTASTVTYGDRGQFTIDLITRTPSGVPTAITNQGSQPPTQVAPGGTSMVSGLHPDAGSPPLHPGRADDVGYMYRDFDLAPGSLVVFLGSFQGFGPFVPLASVIPGSTGVSCLDLSDAFVINAAVLDSNFVAYHTLALPPSVRTSLPQSWAQQGIGYDATANVLHAAPCGKQTFH